MTEKTRHTTSPFSATTSWVGILLLGAGLSSAFVSPTHASAPGPQTASVEWASIDESLGVLSGGVQRDFATGVTGWQAPAFSALGALGIEWTSPTGTETRRGVSPDPGSQSPNPGGESSWSTPGYLSANPNNQIYSEQTVSISGNQVRFSFRHRSLSDESAINRRIYWVAGLSEGYLPVFTGQGSTSLLVRDASGAHPTLIMTATTTAGVASFEGGESLYTPLVDGDRNPTLYVIPGDSADFTMTITVGLVDSDPCSTGAAASFASSQAGTYGVVWESQQSCLQAPTWSTSADGSPSAALSLDFAAPYSPPAAPTTRTLTVAGLPDGVTWERQDDAGSSLIVTVTASEAVAPGDYPVELRTRESVSADGVTLLSRPSRVTGTLTVTAPVPAPEDPAPEPAAGASAASPADGAEASPPAAAPVVSDVIQARPAVRAPPPQDDVVDVPVTPSPDPRSVEGPPRAVPVDREPRALNQVEPIIPEPLAAGVWLGPLMAALAAGGILAGIRRRFSLASQPLRKSSADSR